MSDRFIHSYKLERGAFAVHAPVPVTDTRSNEPLHMPYDAPQCRGCGKQFFPELLSDEAEPRPTWFLPAHYCRQCCNAKAAAEYRPRWMEAWMVREEALDARV